MTTPYPRYRRATGGTLIRIDPKRYRRGRGKVWRDGVKRWKYRQ